MSDDIQGLGEIVDELVAIAKDHLLRVPVRVAIGHAEVDAADEPKTLVVDGIAVENLGVKIVGVAEIIVALLHSGVMVGGGGLAFLEDQFAGKGEVVLSVVGIMDLTVKLGGLLA